MYGRSNARYHLFHEGDGLSTLQNQLKSAANEVASLPEERILNTDTQALAEYFVKKYEIKIPVLDRDNLFAEHHERSVTVYDQFDQREFQVPGEAYDLELPFEGDPIIFKLKPNTFNFNPPQAVVRGSLLYFSISGRTLDPNSVKQQIDAVLNSIEEYLGWHRAMWQSFDDQLRTTVTQAIEERRNRLLQQKDAASQLATLGIKLKEKSGDTRTFVPPAIKQVLKPQLPPMRASQPPEPTLSTDQYATILGLLRDAGRSTEQSSSRIRQLDEEALRDIFLVPLNSHFGTATGEAFNFNGKTDILIKHEGKNLFVAEFKFWGGEKLYSETIDQLLSYLTWRDTKTAIVIFNRNKGFSGVLEKIRETTKAHINFISGPKHLDETSDEYTFSIPHDDDRTVTVSVISFDLGSKK